MNTREVAASLGISPHTVCCQVANGRIRAMQRGKGCPLDISEAEVERYRGLALGRHAVQSGFFRPKPLAERFWEKVDKTGDCWLWTAATDGRGYGVIGLSSKRVAKAHRVSYELAFGPLTAGSHVLHRCDNPPCVRPSHLHAGTHAENVAEAVARDRMERGERHWTKRTGSSSWAIHRSRLAADRP